MIRQITNKIFPVTLAAFLLIFNQAPAEEAQVAQPEVVQPEVAQPAMAQEEKAQEQEVVLQQQEEKQRMLEGIEFLTGYSFGRIDGKNVDDPKRDYNTYPIIVDFDFNLKDLTKRIGINPPSLIQFQLEPYIAYVQSPNSNVELGGSFFFKVGLAPETWCLQPYVKAGAGMAYMSQHTREQSTQFNFIETGAFGLHYFFNKNTAITCEGRIRHLSNAGIDQPNHGINTYSGVAGISYKF